MESVRSVRLYIIAYLPYDGGNDDRRETEIVDPVPAHPLKVPEPTQQPVPVQYHAQSSVSAVGGR
ncbi:hypothetical protein K1S14_24655, partial [Klebsiella pneumoniae]|nr:hypothetical protein [Klebsiella pneumoniae]MCA5509111.1 hypothetical protein [Klebsiella pneumoniae]